MKNILELAEKIRADITAEDGWALWFFTKKTIEANQAVLVKIHHETRLTTNKPSDTVASLISQLGEDAALETIAELVNTVGLWDGRISPAVRSWAAAYPTAATKEELERIRVFTPSEIHQAHIDQLGREAIKIDKNR